MASKLSLPYEDRARNHPNPLARRLFQIASEKQSNVVVSADVTTTQELLDLSDSMSLSVEGLYHQQASISRLSLAHGSRLKRVLPWLTAATY